MTIDEMKQKFIDGTLEKNIYTSGNDKIVKVGKDGFSIDTIQDNGWTRINIYEYIDGQWIESETYEKKFNQSEYKQEYNRTHYKTFKVDLKNEEMDELNELLQISKLTKSQFLRNSIKNLKSKTKKSKD